MSSYQCGFRKQHCTEFAALPSADTITRNIDQGQMTGAVFKDFRKAFDSVNHSLLLKKLYVLGIVDHEYEWFTDYLRGRTYKLLGSRELSQTLMQFASVCPKDRSSDLCYLCFLSTIYPPLPTSVVR